MLEKTDGCSCPACRHDELIKKLFFFEWDDDTPQIKRTLLRLLVIFIESDEVENFSRQEREMIGGHLHQVIDTLEILEDYARKKQGTVAA